MNDYDFEDMYEDKFDNIEELNEFIENMETYTQDKVYYWGAIEDFDGELHTIEELKKEACEGWFKNGSVVTVYNFYKKIYCAILSKCENDSKIEVVDNNFEKAIDKAMENWKNYADSEKYSRHEYAVFACCPISNQVADSYNILWADGDFADIEKYDELSMDSFGAKKAAQMIREYRILKNRNPLLMKEHEDFIAKITEEIENDERYKEQEKETILNQLRKEFLIQEKQAVYGSREALQFITRYADDPLSGDIFMLKSDVYGSDFLKKLEVLGGTELFRRTYEALEDKTEMLVWNEKTGIRSMSQEEFEQKLKLIEKTPSVVRLKKTSKSPA